MSIPDWRHHTLAHLAAERAGLLWQLVGLDRETLTTRLMFGDWTTKDLVAHVAAWDEMATGRVELVLAGREEEVVIFTGADEEARNVAFHAERKDWPLQQVVQALVTARRDFLTILAQVPDDEFHRLRHFQQEEASVSGWTEWRARHDAAHAADLAAWREAQGLQMGVGPRQVLLAAMAAAREALLAAAALVSPDERVSRPVCGEWTLKDVLAHVADWEWVGVEGLRHMAAGQQPQVEHIKDINAWNQAHYEARHDQPWEEVWADFHAAREAMSEVLGEVGQEGLARSFAFPWSEEGTAYRWICVYVAHDREHAEGLREAVGDEAARR